VQEKILEPWLCVQLMMSSTVERVEQWSNEKRRPLKAIICGINHAKRSFNFVPLISYNAW
jgi:hypothetical protein